MRKRLIAFLRKFLEPKTMRLLFISSVAGLIFSFGILFEYCTKDMCFSLVHLISGDRYYFLAANIIKYLTITAFSYVAASLLYGLISKKFGKK